MVDLNWIKLASNDDINRLMEQFDGFHDSCLREFYMSSAAHVNADFSMSFDGKSELIILFQRQAKAHSVLELRFAEVVGFNYQPLPAGYNEVITDATLLLEEGMVYWADHQGWRIEDYKNGDTDSIWIGAKEVSYRFRQGLLGAIKRFKD